MSLTVDTNSRSSVNPGDMVTFKAKASADSLVAFRAVDKSVLLMKEDTDISVMKVCFNSIFLDNFTVQFESLHFSFLPYGFVLCSLRGVTLTLTCKESIMQGLIDENPRYYP